MNQEDTNNQTGKPGPGELTFHQLYSFLLFSGVSFVSIYLPLVLRETGYSPKDIGFLLSVYNIVGLATILLCGRLLDALRCYRTLIFTGLLLAAFAFSRLLFPGNLAGSLFLIILLATSFLPQGSLIDSYISARYQGLPQYYGRIRSMGSVGYIFFLGVAAVFEIFHPYDPWRLQTWVWGLFGLIILMFGGSSSASMRQIRAQAQAADIIPPDSAAKDTESASSSQKTGIRILGWPMIALLLSLIICWSIIMGINSNFLALYLREELHIRNINIFFIVATLSEIPIIFRSGRILYRKPLGWMLLLAFGAALLRLLTYATLPYALPILLSQLLHSAAYGLFHITVIALINHYFTKYRNTAIAIYAAIPTLSNSLGAMLGGILIQEFGFIGFFRTFLFLVLPIFIPIFLMRRRFLNL
ncbi:MFS transporter [Candidatus Haliotispira prima]|uniref:MFS transporter n=1 Tax=Candidatus Haliotispira prima TaxID=3034016 RepID=A0ABY8MI85_9SPIO|nr:MFS transporter [Candidatus Haliotispira prima]